MSDLEGIPETRSTQASFDSNFDDSVPAGEPAMPVRLTYTADFYNRYPGETVTLVARVILNRPSPMLTLRINLPQGVRFDRYQAPVGQEDSSPFIEVMEQGHTVAWTLAELNVGRCYEYQLIGHVEPTRESIELESSAVLTGPDHSPVATAYVTLAVLANSSYLPYLPAFYEQDELVNRLLMCCESFWAPLERQIGNIYDYIDPGLAPAHFLPWLAGWLDLELYEDWPESKLRELLRWAIRLHRARGTHWGLQKYLEIYTGQQAEIVECRFKDFRLDDDEARLDHGIALGPGNRPHTFTINLSLAPLEAENEAERVRREKIRRRTLEAIVEMQKPAHTVYTLNL